MKYLTQFDTHSDYETFKASSDFITPNVSLCVQDNEVHYSPWHDYSQDYLTFEALEDGTFQFTNAVNYSINGGTTWTALAANTATITVTAGNKIMWKAELTPNYNGIGTFSSTAQFDVEGNPMSLLYEDNFIGQTNLAGKGSAFYNLFNGCTNVVSAENISLPATTLAQGCYQYMFQGCTSLTTAPELPATTLTISCYYGMFYSCTSLTTVPSILPATTLTNDCYGIMFYGCTSLTDAPELPATILATQCYLNMFGGCTSLTTAPELPATTLANNCYNYMFRNCSSLNYIKAMFTTKPSTSYTNNWVSGVAASGTFVKNSAATWNVTGVNGIPTGWTVQTASE